MYWEQSLIKSRTNWWRPWGPWFWNVSLFLQIWYIIFVNLILWIYFAFLVIIRTVRVEYKIKKKCLSNMHLYIHISIQRHRKCSMVCDCTETADPRMNTRIWDRLYLCSGVDSEGRKTRNKMKTTIKKKMLFNKL